MAYGARLESVLGATPRGFESRILRSHPAECGLRCDVSPRVRTSLRLIESSADLVRVLR